MDSDAADPNWWTSSPKRPREEEDEDVVKFPLCHVVTAADLEYSTEVAALMADHSSLPASDIAASKKKKRKVVPDKGEEITTSSSNNGNVTNAPTVENTQVHVATAAPSSSSVLISRTDQPAETTTQSRVHHYLEYNGGSLFTNNASTTPPISAPPIPCSALNPWFLSNGIPNFSKAYQPTSSSSSSSSGDAKRKLDETDHPIQAAAVAAAATADDLSTSMLHKTKRARLPAPLRGGDGVVSVSVSDGQGTTSAAAVTLDELRNEKRKQADLETLLVSAITGGGNNSSSSSLQLDEPENSNPAAKRPCRTNP